MFKHLFFIAVLQICVLITNAQVQYPYPVERPSVNLENRQLTMAYMDVKPVTSNDNAILLLHGKNFNGYYWKDVIPFLTAKGYRVIVPDQLGFGRSDKKDLHYSFHMLAATTKQLLDSLQIKKVVVLGHSMGGMLASRFTLMYPEMVSKLILENPIGLEDYKTFVPYQPLSKLWDKEKKATFESYKKYQQSYYPQWKPEYEQYVAAQAESLSDPHFDTVALANAITYQMILEQPVVYELNRITVPTLLIIGQADRTVVGKDQLTDKQKKQYGNYPMLGKQTQQKIKNSKLVELPGVGHIPHIQEPASFFKAINSFL